MGRRTDEGTAATLHEQRARLERALSTAREWSVEEWGVSVRAHPRVAPLARRLLFGQYDAEGTLVQSFRIDDEDRLTSSRDEPVALDPGHPVRLVHPIDLDADERAAWGELLADYEIIEPFPQLARPIRAPHPDDAGGAAIRRFDRSPLEARLLRAALERAGWVEGEPDDEVRVRYFAKRFERAGLVAVVSITPGLHVDRVEQEPQTIEEACFVVRMPGGLSAKTALRVPLARVPAAAISEVIYELETLAG